MVFDSTSVVTDSMSDSTLLNILIKMNARVKETNCRRYTDLEKDICAFEFLMAGNAHFQYISSNAQIMSKKTIQRHVQLVTCQINEGVLDVAGLKNYLMQNGYPLAVALCEDGTRITAAAEYDYGTDAIRGLVAPLDSKGFPIKDMFPASTPYRIAEYVNSYPLGNYAYVQLAVPLASDAAPYVLYHSCTNNQFQYKDVLNRWTHTEHLLQCEGIKVISHASDGDSRLLKSMKNRAGLETQPIPSPWGQWFRVNYEDSTPINVQDMVHTINKFRNRLLKSSMEIGKRISFKFKT